MTRSVFPVHQALVYIAHLSVIPGRPVNTSKHFGIVMAVQWVHVTGQTSYL